MLFILTGQIQIGKTRWLQSMVARLEKRGIATYGVLAPGDWIKHLGADGVASYEKLGINNVLLPQHETIAFARRNDLLASSNLEQSCTQSQRAQLAWAIDDGAIRRVNDHFDALASSEQGTSGLLIVDELGRLELLRDEGLSAATRIIERGATPLYPHALIVVREQLHDVARNRFAESPWNGMQSIGPDASGEKALMDAFAL